MSKFNLKVHVNASSQEELADTLALIQKQIADGYREGYDRNETGDYHYDIAEDHEEE
jgi:hypothetical protein